VGGGVKRTTFVKVATKGKKGEMGFRKDHFREREGGPKNGETGENQSVTGKKKKKKRAKKEVARSVAKSLTTDLQK